jgi:hypothetical protein
VLDRLVEQTQPLIDDARDGGWDADEAARLAEVTEKQQEVLATTQVAPDAQASLSAAVDVSKTGAAVLEQILHPPTVIEPSVALTSTPTPEPSETPTPYASPADATPGTDASPIATEPPTSGTPVLATTEIVISAEPVETRNGVELFSVTAGSLTFLAPSSADGWKLDGAPESGVPALIKFSNQDNSSLIIINTLDGDMWWYASRNGQFDEVRMRVTKDGGTFVADRDVLRASYGSASDIPWYVMQSIALIPAPPTPTETATPPVATATAAP